MINSRILFMGTPDFARTALKALVDSGANVIGVLTQPDKPKGRKMILTPSPVKEEAIIHEIPVYQPKTLRGDDFAALLADLNPDMIVVAAYGKILPDNVLTYPKYGCINIHGSLLPRYRGAAPIQRAIIEGEKETGVTIMYMDSGIDTGDMLAKASTPITPEDNFETVHDRLAEMGAKLLLETLEKIEAGTAVREKQDDLKSSYAVKIENEDCLLDFDADAVSVHNRIRGLSPFPLAEVMQGGRKLKLVSSELLDSEKPHRNPGEVLSCDAKNNRFEVACRVGSVAVTGVLPEGKGRMKSSDYINGRRIAVGERLTKL